jgi:hypothetical protein
LQQAVKQLSSGGASNAKGTLSAANTHLTELWVIHNSTVAAKLCERACMCQSGWPRQKLLCAAAQFRTFLERLQHFLVVIRFL